MPRSVRGHPKKNNRNTTRSTEGGEKSLGRGGYPKCQRGRGKGEEPSGRRRKARVLRVTDQPDHISTPHKNNGGVTVY